MNQYGQLSRELRVLHERLLIASDDTPGSTIDQWADREAAVSARMIEMEAVESDDHAQVEEYRASQGWLPCFACQDRQAAAAQSAG